VPPALTGALDPARTAQASATRTNSERMRRTTDLLRAPDS
jgi:hypothetical protein